MKREDRIKGALYGIAVGDAMGVTTEFMKPEDIIDKYGKVTEITGGGLYNTWRKGEWSDDTEMTLLVLQGLLDNTEDPIPHIGQHFAEWLATKPKDVGNTIRYAYTIYNMYNDWFEATKVAHEMLMGETAGNGSLMRTLPIALIYKELPKIVKLSEKQSKMTHFSDEAAEACVIYNKIAFRLINGGDLKESILSTIKGTKYSGVISSQARFNPDGYVVNTLSWALILLLNTNSFEEAIIQAVNMGYDSDTLASVTGGLAGIYYGFDAIPIRWTEDLLKGDTLEEYLEKIKLF
ncbi:ADP-ribosylglycohydrolase family protein [Bacillus luti]|nr:ADP-ribosylglycohydrolase [Bacillus cereus]